MDNLELIFSIATAAIGFLAAALTFILKFVKSQKAKVVAEDLLGISNALLSFIGQAEKLAVGGGKEKKEFVMELAQQFAAENDIEFAAEQVSEQVDELVAFSKQVNRRRKDAMGEAVLPKTTRGAKADGGQK